MSLPTGKCKSAQPIVQFRTSLDKNLISSCMCKGFYIYMCVCVFVHVCVCVCVYIYICVCIYIYIYMCVCVCVCVFITVGLCLCLEEPQGCLPGSRGCHLSNPPRQACQALHKV